MSKYALVIGGEIKGILDIDDAWYQSLVASNNPKASFYYPIVEGQQGDYDPTTEVLYDSFTINEGTVVRSWSKRSKTEEEVTQGSSKIYTAYEFLLRFTSEERASFRAAAVTDVGVADFMQLAQAAQEINTTDPITVAGMNYLVSIGLLTEQRKSEILA